MFGDPEESAQWLEPFLHARELGCNKLRPEPELRALLLRLHESLDPERPHWKLGARGLITHILSITARLFAERCAAFGMPLVRYIQSQRLRRAPVCCVPPR